MSATMAALHAARNVAWAALVPAFDHAIAMARECEFMADQAANVSMTHVSPAYPPLVQLLAEAAPDAEAGAA